MHRKKIKAFILESSERKKKHLHFSCWLLRWALQWNKQSFTWQRTALSFVRRRNERFKRGACIRPPCGAALVSPDPMCWKVTAALWQDVSRLFQPMLGFLITSICSTSPPWTSWNIIKETWLLSVFSSLMSPYCRGLIYYYWTLWLIKCAQW